MSMTAASAPRTIARWAFEAAALPPRERVAFVRRRQRQIKRDIERAPTPGIRAALTDARHGFDAVASALLHGVSE